jgi:hypothetical protein
MPMRNIHDVGRKPNTNHIDAGFVGIPQQNRLLNAMSIWDILPMYLSGRDPDEVRIVPCDAAHSSADSRNH